MQTFVQMKNRALGGPVCFGLRVFVLWQISDPRLSEFLPIFESDRVDLLPRQFLSRIAGSAAGFAKEAVEARRHHDPQQNQFLIWTAETMPRVLGYENRSTSFASMTDIVECDHATAFQNVEGFVLVEMSVNRNARALG
jgi:hypothetical protein